MQVFKLFFKVAKSKTVVILLYVGIFLAICFPMVHANQEKVDFEETRASVCIIDEDQSDASTKLKEYMADKNDLVELKHDKQGIMDAMYYEVVNYTLVIPKGYEERIMNLKDDSEEALFQTWHLRDSYQSAMVEQQLSIYIRCLRGRIACGDTLEEATVNVQERMNQQVAVEIVTYPKEEPVDPNYQKNFSIFFRIMPYLLIAIMVNVLSPILMTFQRKDQKNRIACSSIRISSYMMQIFLGCGVLAVIIWLLFMGSGMLVYGGIYRGLRCHLAVFNSFLFALIAAMIAILITSFNPSGTVVNMIAQILGLGMAFLCGAFVPQNMLGDGVLAVAKILPAFWYERANDLLAGIQEGGLTEVYTCFGVELCFLALITAATVLAFTVRGRAGQ